MTKRFLAFDLETAKYLPGAPSNLLAHRPLGICCAAAVASDFTAPRVWHGHDASGGPSARLSVEEAAALVRDLEGLVAAGYTLVTWNGLGFDWDVLAEESRAADACRRLALAHVDLMFHFYCVQGYPISLDSAARGMGLSGKSTQMTGELAPKMWAEGRHQEVLDYVTQDARLTLELATRGASQKRLCWFTQKGQSKSISLRSGWLGVSDAQTLPLPDTSWMKTPIPRSRFTGWLNAK